MGSKEIELIIVNISLGLGAILILNFMFRVLKILITKQVNEKQDFVTILFIVATAIHIMMLYDYLKKLNKKP